MLLFASLPHAYAAQAVDRGGYLEPARTRLVAGVPARLVEGVENVEPLVVE